MKVKIQQRSVYHKYAEVEISVDKDDYEDYLINNKFADIQEYLLEKGHLYSDKIDEAIAKAPYEYGFGTDSSMDESDQESEWRFECEQLKIGGHL
tara:strand:- start:10176 stop:10460 length:285 start_codon:yes stop_codon:yes gene_type:complete